MAYPSANPTIAMPMNRPIASPASIVQAMNAIAPIAPPAPPPNVPRIRPRFGMMNDMPKPMSDPNMAQATIRAISIRRILPCPIATAKLKKA